MRNHSELSIHLPQTAGRLIVNALRFNYLKRRGLPGRPQALSMEITHKCVARCVMCNIWKIPDTVVDLDAGQWLDLLSRDLFSELIELDITGGEPFLKPDFHDLLPGICRLKKAGGLPKLASVIITTNGFLTKKVLPLVKKVLPVLKETGLGLVIVCAMDGIGQIHDTIRNYPRAWEKVDQTLTGLVELRKSASHLIIGLKTTILPVNVSELNRIEAYAQKRDLFTIISPLILTRGRYLNMDKTDGFSFSREDVKAMADFFSRGRTRWGFHSKALVDYFKTGIMKKPCTCGFNYFFIRSSGELFLCPLIDRSVGNITHSPVETVLNSATAVRLRKRIGSFPQCRGCTEPGLERYSLTFQGWSYLLSMLKTGGRRFTELHCHMGLDKYI